MTADEKLAIVMEGLKGKRSVADISGEHTLKEIADYLKVHYTTVSKALKKAELEN